MFAPRRQKAPAMVDATTACARSRTGDRKDAKPDKMKMAGLYGGGNPGSNSKDKCAPYMWAVGGGAARKEEELRIRLRRNQVTLSGKDKHDEVRRRAALAKTKKELTHRPVDQPAASNSLGLCGLDEEDGSSCDLLAPFVEDKPITTAAGRNKEAASDALQYWPEPCGGNAEWAPVKVAPVEDKPFLSPSIPQADSTGDASAHSDIKPWIPSTAAADVLFRNYNRSPSIPLPASSAVLTPPPSPPKATVKLEADDYITCKQEPSSRPAFPTPSASHLPDAAIFTPLLSPVGEALAAAPAAAPLSPPLVNDGAAEEEDWSRILAGPFARSRAPSVESRPASRRRRSRFRRIAACLRSSPRRGTRRTGRGGRRRSERGGGGVEAEIVHRTPALAVDLGPPCCTSPPSSFLSIALPSFSL